MKKNVNFVYKNWKFNNKNLCFRSNERFVNYYQVKHLKGN